MTTVVKDAAQDALLTEFNTKLEARIKAKPGGPMVRAAEIARLFLDDPELHRALAALPGEEIVKGPTEGPSALRTSIVKLVDEEADELVRRTAMTPHEARAKVWRDHPDWFEAYHRPGSERPGGYSVTKSEVQKKADLDARVAGLSKVMALGEPQLGLELVGKHFPELLAKWEGRPAN